MSLLWSQIVLLVPAMYTVSVLDLLEESTVKAVQQCLLAHCLLAAELNFCEPLEEEQAFHMLKREIQLVSSE